MNQGSLKQQFEKDGYVVVPAVFNEAEMAQLRQATTEIFEKQPQYPGDRSNIRFDWIMRYPQLRRIVLKEKLLNALKEVGGDDFLFLPDAAFMDSCYGGWHRDTGPLEHAGKFFHYEPDCLLVNVAIYLQTNDPQYAGGLDVVPGSHKTQATWWQKKKSKVPWIKFVLHHLIKRKFLSDDFVHSRKGSISIPSASGDVVFFNHQCDHRATQLKAPQVPESRRKFALFFSFSPNNKYARLYVDHIRNRSDNIFLKNYAYPEGLSKELGPVAIQNFYKDELIPENF